MARTATIYCSADDNSKQHFYLQYEGNCFYLFSQDFRRGVQNYYGRGVDFDHAIDQSRGKFDSAILRTMRKIVPHVKYIEKEYDICILNKTKKQYA